MTDMRERLAKWASLNDLVEREVCARDFELADAIQAEIDAAGYAVVPKEPTLEMRAAACRALFNATSELDSEAAIGCYVAAIDALTKEAGDER